MPPQLWEVVGGVEQGGILVRQGAPHRGARRRAARGVEGSGVIRAGRGRVKSEESWFEMVEVKSRRLMMLVVRYYSSSKRWGWT